MNNTFQNLSRTSTSPRLVRPIADVFTSSGTGCVQRDAAAYNATRRRGRDLICTRRAGGLVIVSVAPQPHPRMRLRRRLWTRDGLTGYARKRAGGAEINGPALLHRSMRAAGFVVPETFEELLRVQKTYENLVKKGVVVLKAEMDAPVIPMDWKNSALSASLRPPSSVTSAVKSFSTLVCISPTSSSRISDKAVSSGCCGSTTVTKCIEMVLILTANRVWCCEHHRHVSRFGGTLDEAAAMFLQVHDTGLAQCGFVDNSHNAAKLISGIGPKIKSVNNPDLEFVK
ncbi:hypothetical protein C8R45DRAFT_1090359 [Mycena sanguinolenta]|nr:hypothetical protein C8R45DRAFT_1090359 [Mycena sanguinolenta]